MIDEYSVYSEMDKRARELYPKEFYMIQTGNGKFLYFSSETNRPIFEFSVSMLQTDWNEYKLQIEVFDYKNKLYE